MQGGEELWDALSLQVIFRKRALWLVAILRKPTCNLRLPVSLRHPVALRCIFESRTGVCLCWHSTKRTRQRRWVQSEVMSARSWCAGRRWAREREAGSEQEKASDREKAGSESQWNHVWQDLVLQSVRRGDEIKRNRAGHRKKAGSKWSHVCQELVCVKETRQRECEFLVKLKSCVPGFVVDRCA